MPLRVKGIVLPASIRNILCPPHAHHVQDAIFPDLQEAGSTEVKWEFLLKCFDAWAADREQRGWSVGWRKAFSVLGTSVIPALTELQLFTSIHLPPDLFLTRNSPSHAGLCLSLWLLLVVAV